jgi:uncharacterized protein (TIGR03435 family)
MILMLQTLLANEFKLVVHREQKPMNVFELTVGKGGPKFQKAAGTGKPDCERTFGATYAILSRLDPTVMAMARCTPFAST